jgi:hypothetical protein
MLSSPWVRLLHVRVETRHVHAERHLAKAGVARRKGRGISHPWSGGEAGAKRTKRSEGLHKRSAEDWGNPCAARSGQSPLARLVFLIGVLQHAWIFRVGVAGRNRHAEILSCFTSFSFLFRSVQSDSLVEGAQRDHGTRQALRHIVPNRSTMSPRCVLGRFWKWPRRH